MTDFFDALLRRFDIEPRSHVVRPGNARSRRELRGDRKAPNFNPELV